MNPVSILESSVHTYSCAFDTVLVVLRKTDHALAEKVASFGAQPVYAADAELGMGHSLAAGIQAVTASSQPCSWAFVGLLDMPFVQIATLETLKQACAHVDVDAIVRPKHTDEHNESHWGHPIGWPAHYFAELEVLRGDTGARGLLKKYASSVIPVEIADSGIYLDIDQPTDVLGGGQPYSAS